MQKQTNLVLLLICLAQGCTHRIAQMTPSPAILSDNSYTDLTAGGRLRIMVPLLKSGEYRITAGSQEQKGNTFVIPAADLVGYQVSFYSIEARSRGTVRLKLSSAQTTKDGVTVQVATPPTLPFVLPSKALHIRLIYYIRQSESDHNMAIASSKDSGGLDAFTNRLKLDPRRCKNDAVVSCVWVPAGVAVRPE